MEISKKKIKFLMRFLVKKVPVHRCFRIPFFALPYIMRHIEEFFSGVTEHIPKEQPHIGEFLPFIPRHLIEQGAFSMNHSSWDIGRTKFSEKA